MANSNTRGRYADGKGVDELFPGVMAKTRRYELLNSGAIKAKKLGATTVFDLDSIEAYIDSLPDYTAKAA
jgi:hypothetical protein